MFLAMTARRKLARKYGPNLLPRLLFKTAASIQTSGNEVSPPKLPPHLSKDRRPTVLARTPPTNSYSYPTLASRTVRRRPIFSPFCQRVLTKWRTLVDAHFKLVGEHSLSAKLRRWGVAVSRVPTRHSWGGGALERGHGAPLEPFAQFGDALGGVVPSVERPVETERAARAREMSNMIVVV